MYHIEVPMARLRLRSGIMAASLIRGLTSVGGVPAVERCMPAASCVFSCSVNF